MSDSPVSPHHPGKDLELKGDALTPAQVRRLAQFTNKHQMLLRKAWAGTLSPRQAIKVQCLECCGEDIPSISGCTSPCCSLWKYRPYQRNA